MFWNARKRDCGKNKTCEKKAAAALHKNETQVKVLLNYQVQCAEGREE